MLLLFRGILLVALASANPLESRFTFQAKEPPQTKPPQFKLSPIEKKILDLTNQARTKAELPPLKPNAKLFQAARDHSANMARQGKMEHVLDGKNPAQRVDATGYNWNRIGENIAFGQNTRTEAVFQGWMESPLHRENILNRHFEEIGIGAVSHAKGEMYYTQVFGTPRSQR
jgi:uncharacterized protein YkwD